MFTEIDASDQLPHHYKVDALGGDVGAQGTGGGEDVKHSGGAHVGEELHTAAQLQKTAFGTVVGRLRIPFGAAHRTQQHTVGGQALGKTLVRQGNAVSVNGVAAHGRFGVGEAVTEFFGHGVQYGDGFRYDLRADAVAADHGDVLVHSVASFALREAIRPPLAIMSLMKGGKGSA